MTNATYQQVLWPTGLAFCPGPDRRVDLTEATHAVGIAAAAEGADDSRPPGGRRLIGQPRPGSD